MTCRGRNGGAGVDTYAPHTRMSYSYHECGCDARFSHGVTVTPPRSYPSLTSQLIIICILQTARLPHICPFPLFSSVHSLVRREKKKAPSTKSKWARKADPTGRRQSGMQKAESNDSGSKPSHGVLLAERAGRESLVQSFQSGIRFLWLFAHEPGQMTEDDR
jgi:hypothetical protein